MSKMVSSYVPFVLGYQLLFAGRTNTQAVITSLHIININEIPIIVNSISKHVRFMLLLHFIHLKNLLF